MWLPEELREPFRIGDEAHGVTIRRVGVRSAEELNVVDLPLSIRGSVILGEFLAEPGNQLRSLCAANEFILEILSTPLPTVSAIRIFREMRKNVDVALLRLRRKRFALDRRCDQFRLPSFHRVSQK